MLDKIKKFIDEELIDFADLFGHYIVIGILIICMIMGIGVISENHTVSTIMSIVYGLIIVAGLFLFFHTVISKMSRKSKLLWPLTTSIVMLVLSCFFLWSNNIQASNELCIIAIISFEIYSLYIIISSCFVEETRINRIIAFSVIFIGLGYYAIHLTYDANAANNSVFDSLITIFSAIIGGGITLIGVGLTIKNQEKTRIQQKQEEMIKDCPLITFVEIDSMKADKKHWINNGTSNTLLLNRGQNLEKAKEYDEANVFLRFKFKCASKNQLKNITFTNVTIYSEFLESEGTNEHAYSFDSKCENYQDINVSLVDETIYQTCVHLTFGSEVKDKGINKFEVNTRKRDEMIKSLIVSKYPKHAFFNIDYVATNMNNVSYSGTLKFYCNVWSSYFSEYKCNKYSNVSNWIKTQPHIIKNECN